MKNRRDYNLITLSYGERKQIGAFIYFTSKACMAVLMNEIYFECLPYMSWFFLLLGEI